MSRLFAIDEYHLGIYRRSAAGFRGMPAVNTPKKKVSLLMSNRVIAMLGTYPPRRCGIATFTEDLAEALVACNPNVDVGVVALNDDDPRTYPSRVMASFGQDDLAAYEQAADALNARNIDIVCVQHEFGIFGGSDGSYLLALLRRLRMPIVTTMHTVLEPFTPGQARVVEELASLSASIIVTGERAVRFLAAQGVPSSKIVIIPHGIPSIPADGAAEKARMGLAGRDLVMTFGLLSPNKGIETAIRAMPALLRDRPDAFYLVQGATHPHVRAQQGEAYRDSLLALARDLGVSARVHLDDGYRDLDGVTRALAAADVCLLPYRSREQITSGTLAYAVGNGKAVVSTPFWHAEELLADGRGVLTPFGDHDAMALAVRDLLADNFTRTEVERRARAYGARMSWPVVARAYLEAFSSAAARNGLRRYASPQLPAARLDHLVALTDDTGVVQHATGIVPNYAEGYATDDNARVLHLAALLRGDAQADLLARRTLAFLHYAFDPKAGRFRNFMSYDRRWLEADGGDNVQARAIRGLVAASSMLGNSVAATARELLVRSTPAILNLTSPKAKAIALIALADLEAHAGLSTDLRAKADSYADDLLKLLADTATPSWVWFEGSLSYSNAKLPHGLIAYGRVFKNPAALSAGLDALRWLEGQQTAADGCFLPVGCERTFSCGEARPLWDGQPIEVYATVSATLEAYRATADVAWLHAARRALEWLFGRNVNGLSLYDEVTGGCCDGLQRDRVNMNQGAESTLAMLLSLTEYRQMTAMTLHNPPCGEDDSSRPAHGLINGPSAAR